ncbi:hypothetical protein AYL99_03517 [Fonsecaea erecta]|uniref:SAP domain-containing protein n=1 Tax=Fonsecaea erecta TaxID=1367422 RepID=A0A178ZPL9_9EURO|nr:hypothetical protein AYL99_03517 [Fonsecaea erecta]OAP61316.1 hypothetical protein AYL99_03517 [Fonsecaea erecta]
MAGNKRALSQVDGNAAQTQPPSKRASQQSAAGEENETGGYASMKKLELSQLLQERNLPCNGSKDVLVRRLEESDRSRTSVTASELTSREGSAAAQSAGRWFKYTTLCRPLKDIAAEKWAGNLDDGTPEEFIQEKDEEYNEQYDEEKGDAEVTAGATSEDGQRKSHCGRKGCICKRPASELPEHRWILTTMGYQEVARLQWQVRVRDQDEVEEYFGSDYNAYGFQEVMENQLLSFNSEFSERETAFAPARLWSIIEGFAWLLNDPLPWFHSDDPGTTLERLQMIGGAVFATLNIFEKTGLLGADSPVKNIGLVLGVLYNNTREWPGDLGVSELSWRGAMIREALQHGIEVKGQPYGIETLLDKDGVYGTQSSKGDMKWKRAFSKKHKSGSTIGGQHYVLASAMEVAVMDMASSLLLFSEVLAMVIQGAVRSR